MSHRIGLRGIALLAIVASGMLVGAQTPLPTLLVLNKSENALVVVDPASKRVLGKVPTGEGPHELAVAADGKLAFVSNYGSGQAPGHTISVVDLAARKELRRVDLKPFTRPHGLFAADGKVYFTAEANRAIGRYDPAANQIDWVMGTGQTSTHMVLLNKDSSRIFTANIGSDSIMVLERGANPGAWNATVVPVGRGPEGLDLSPDGTQLWAAHSRDGGVSIVDVAAKKVTQTLNLQTKRSNRLKFTPDGRLALVSDLDGGELVVVDVASRKEIKRVKLGRAPEGILVAPDSSRAYVAVNGDDYVAIVDLKGLDVVDRIATGPGSGPDGLAWRSAGR
ncbi:MAG: beta-propeller fold lactonase family protein [Acidobacteria bacterium]|nr:beta-propeller fold lactonase family protein [Acidobacteriota bacterium]